MLEEAEEEEEVAPARGRRGRQSSEDTSVSDRAAAPEPGTTIGKLMESRRSEEILVFTLGFIYLATVLCFYVYFVAPEADLRLLQHPRWSTL